MLSLKKTKKPFNLALLYVLLLVGGAAGKFPFKLRPSLSRAVEQQDSGVKQFGHMKRNLFVSHSRACWFGCGLIELENLPWTPISQLVRYMLYFLVPHVPDLQASSSLRQPLVSRISFHSFTFLMGSFTPLKRCTVYSASWLHLCKDLKEQTHSEPLYKDCTLHTLFTIDRKLVQQNSF